MALALLSLSDRLVTLAGPSSSGTMQCLRARPLIRPSSFPLKLSPAQHIPRRLRFSSLRNPKSTITMGTTIEHIVLFKVKDNTDESKIDAMVNGLNSLVSLDPVLSLSTGPVFRTRSPISLFTHVLHSRYKSKDDLAAYSSHPDHVRVVNEFVRPICDDIMAVDWVADQDPQPLVPPPGSAARVTFLKLNDGVAEEVKGEILSVIKGIREGIPGIQQLTCGENFSPARAKGFSIASIAVFPSVAAMNAVEENGEFVAMQKEKVRDHLDGVIVVDYSVPSPSSSTL